MSDRIDDFLVLIARDLRGPTIESHKTLLETEDHLRLSASDLVRAGMSEEDAQKEAIARFGLASEVAKGHNAEARGYSLRAIFLALTSKAVELIALAFVAIGVSAGLAYLLALITSRQTVFGLPVTALPNAQTCSYWLANNPSATNCQQAGTFEAAHDMTWMLGGLGIIGILILLAMRGWNWGWFQSIQTLPPSLSSAIATAMFFVAGVALFAFGQSNAVIAGSWGRGMWYSESATALVASAISAIYLLRAIREPFRQI